MRIVLAILVNLVASLVLTAGAGAEPGEHWERADPAMTEWAATASREVAAYGAAHRPTAVMIIHDGRIVADWGDVGRKVNVRSVRKSLLGTLYGIMVQEGRIRLSATLAELGIDDKARLSTAEKQATVRDLLAARSGVYHLAAYETSDMRQKRPPRGSHAAGTFWFYNNWDFNALGTIYRTTTGEDLFASFARRIARPIGMEDFSARDGSYVTDPASLHPAYPFRMTARDLARFGLLILDEGRWNGKEIIPAAWVRESTTAVSPQTDRPGRAYGYLWWVLAPDDWGPGAAIALGYGGEVVAVIPAKRLIAVQTVDAAEIHTSVFLDLVRKILAGAP